jgi:hypothetical protein
MAMLNFAFVAFSKIGLAFLSGSKPDTKDLTRWEIPPYYVYDVIAGIEKAKSRPRRRG